MKRRTFINTTAAFAAAFVLPTAVLANNQTKLYEPKPGDKIKFLPPLLQRGDLVNDDRWLYHDSGFRTRPEFSDGCVVLSVHGDEYRVLALGEGDIRMVHREKLLPIRDTNGNVMRLTSTAGIPHFNDAHRAP